jgi:hypothetical protein
MEYEEQKKMSRVAYTDAESEVGFSRPLRHCSKRLMLFFAAKSEYGLSTA